jgi:hypothetical protein
MPDRKAETTAEVQSQTLQQMQHVRQIAGIHPAIRRV